MKSNTINSLFLKAIGKPAKKLHEVYVEFKNGSSATYTTASLGLLMTDRDVALICDCETGELLKY